MSRANKKIMLLNLPAGLWVFSILGMVYCFGFAVINSLLVLYASTAFHLSTKEAYLLSASYNSLLFTAPLLGGYLSEKTGYHLSLMLGPVLATLAFACLSTLDQTWYYIGLGLFVTATAYFVPSLYVMIGKLFSKDDPARESAYTLQYIIMNLGFLLGGLLGGYLHIWLNYRIEFLIGMCTSLSILPIYLFLRKWIVPEEGRITGSQLGLSPLFNMLLLVLIAFGIVLCSYFVLRNPTQYDVIIIGLVLIISLAIAIEALKRKKQERRKLFTFLILSYFSIAFWTLYSMEPALLTVFINKFVDRHLFGTLIPSTSFYALDPLFVIFFGSILSYVWLYLARKKRNPSLPAKFALSLLIMSFGFPILVLGIHLTSPLSLISPYFIIAAYVLFAIAELLISPIGIDMVERLSPEGMEGRLMGVWQLFTGVAGAMAGILSQLAVVPKKTPPALVHGVYSSAFLRIGAITFVIAVLAFLIRPYLLKLLRS